MAGTLQVRTTEPGGQTHGLRVREATAQPVTETPEPVGSEVWLTFDAALDALCTLCPKLTADDWEQMIDAVRTRALTSTRKDALSRLMRSVDRYRAIADPLSEDDEHLPEVQA